MEKPNVIQEEIKALEQVLAEKKKELTETGQEVKHEEVAREVVKAYTAPPSVPASPSAPAPNKPAPQDDSKQIAEKFASEPHAKQVEELLKIARTKGILNASQVARHINNPHLLDDFHDRLVFEFFKEKKESA